MTLLLATKKQEYWYNEKEKCVEVIMYDKNYKRVGKEKVPFDDFSSLICSYIIAKEKDLKKSETHLNMYGK